MTTLIVGMGEAFATISAAAAARSGDTVDVQAGTYTNDFPRLINNLTIEGVGGPVHLVATAPPPTRRPSTPDRALAMARVPVTPAHLGRWKAPARGADGG